MPRSTGLRHNPSVLLPSNRVAAGPWPGYGVRDLLFGAHVDPAGVGRDESGLHADGDRDDRDGETIAKT